ncbi:DUF2945 domain-containing protein [Roseibium sp.]|uniref:DUF2945 domain-containing protein n=1 Tax=Roseibium sp. TaxID=1936156 RepID=UPI00391A7F71
MTEKHEPFSKGDWVAWNWGEGTGEATVVDKHTEDACLNIKGTDVKRRATPEDPAYTLRQDDGDRVLKSASELTLIKKGDGK